jgi:hypothetical protein
MDSPLTAVEKTKSVSGLAPLKPSKRLPLLFKNEKLTCLTHFTVYLHYCVQRWRIGPSASGTDKVLKLGMFNLLHISLSIVNAPKENRE